MKTFEKYKKRFPETFEAMNAIFEYEKNKDNEDYLRANIRDNLGHIVYEMLDRKDN